MTAIEKSFEALEKSVAKVNAIVKAIKDSFTTAEQAPAVEESTKTASEVAALEVEEVAAPEVEEAAPTTEKAEELNKSEMIRKYFEKHGMECKNKDIVDYALKTYKIKLNPSLVSIIRGTMAEHKGGKAKATKEAVKPGRVEGVNKSEMIRKYFEKHGMECKNKDIVDYALKTYKVDLNPSLVSIIRATMAEHKGKKTKAPKQSKESLAGLPMTALTVAILQKSRGRDGLKLSEITDLVIKSGYKYSGGKGREGITQNVWQALNNLSRKTAHPGYDGEVAVILKDAASHRYRLNPKAKRRKVA
jgi:hypothetical protein